MSKLIQISYVENNLWFTQQTFLFCKCSDATQITFWYHFSFVKKHQSPKSLSSCYTFESLLHHMLNFWILQKTQSICWITWIICIILHVSSAFFNHFVLITLKSLITCIISMLIFWIMCIISQNFSQKHFLL